jgi:hypothetical protein
MQEFYIERLIQVFTDILITLIERDKEWLLNDCIFESLKFDLFLNEQFQYSAERGLFVYLSQKHPAYIDYFVGLEKSSIYTSPYYEIAIHYDRDAKFFGERNQFE